MTTLSAVLADDQNASANTLAAEHFVGQPDYLASDMSNAQKVLFYSALPDSPVDAEALAKSGFISMVKPILDVTAAAAAIVFLAPLFLLLAIAIKIDSRGPILFAQTRTGYLGRRFKLYKFRTMVADAEKKKKDLQHLNIFASDSPDFKIANDPRITRLGRFLRKSSLDELPNLFNVLQGDISLVGPRPTSFSMETYKPHHYYRLMVKPGITGLWQVNGRADVDFDERVEMDVEYINSMSTAMDSKIIAETLLQCVKPKGAY